MRRAPNGSSVPTTALDDDSTAGICEPSASAPTARRDADATVVLFGLEIDGRSNGSGDSAVGPSDATSSAVVNHRAGISSWPHQRGTKGIARPATNPS